MKKMIALAAALFVAVVANASSINWSFTWATNAAGEDIAAGSAAYLIAVSSYSVADATAAFDAGTFDSSKAAIATTTSLNDASGAFVSTTASSTLEGTQSFYTVIVADGQYMMTSPIQVTMKSVGNTNVAFMELSDESGTSSFAWKPAGGNVPEPTTGLLVLLGMAGLALKRKVA